MFGVAIDWFNLLRASLRMTFKTYKQKSLLWTYSCYTVASNYCITNGPKSKIGYNLQKS